MIQLKNNATLQCGKYKIISTLGQGGFGITYLAEQTMLERKVAIKEFFMKELCGRDESTSHVSIGTEGSCETVNRFREKFIKEARNIAKLNHPNIVRIIDVFEENGTAYYVMEYCENGSLAGKVKEQGCMPESVATRYVIQVAEALDYIHQRKMNHLDVKPANIMLNEKDNVVLIDFGLSKQYDTSGQQTSTTPVGISEGYAPMEQYKQGGVGEFSPETDIYALGATFFKLLTGVTPPSAFDVNEDGVPVDELKSKGVSQKAIDIICKTMEPRKRDRMKNVRLFIDGLQGGSTFANLSDEEITVFTPDDLLTVEELKRIEAEAKAAKEKAETEACAKAEAGHKAKEDAERKVHEIEVQRRREAETAQKKEGNFTKTWIGMIVAGIILVGIFAITSKFSGDNVSSASSNSQQQEISSQTYTANGVSFDMMKVKGGTFTMGSINGADKEKPAHQVTLSDFSIGKTEVTQALWTAVMGKSVSQIASENDKDTCGVGDNYPMYYISYNDCKTFISKLNSITGKNFRMPTEAEWKFAARGGNNSKGYKFSGSNTLGNVAWYKDNSGGDTHEVGTKSPNELGIYDMSGNVGEWCSDWYGDYNSSSQTNPTGPSSGSDCVVRGGSWYDSDWSCRFSRCSYAPDSRYDDLGLRLCLSE